jgi:predicted nucleic acid-binding protein
LVTTYGVVGNRLYDARLVAAMTVHGVGRILTFNHADFSRYPIEVVDPATVS